MPFYQGSAMSEASIIPASISKSGPTRRIAALDGLRGLSILLVLLYHTYSRWADRVPWTASYRDFILFEHGGLGVNLFFIISGFVIFMTLHTCQSFREFIYRRWLRLFPAMLLSTALIYVTADWMWERPVGALTWRDTIPGLLFLDPWVLNSISPFDLHVIEGAFWSIFVEVKFYLVFGSLYFLDRNRTLYYLAFLFFGTWGCIHFQSGASGSTDGVLFMLKKVLSLHHMGWFLIGALLYNALFTRSVASLVVSVCVLPFAIVADSGRDLEVFMVCSALYIVFVATLFHRATASFFSSRFFLFWGFVSYPLYLIHQNMTVALTIKTHSYFEELPGLLTPIPGLVGVVAVSYLIAAYGEPTFRGLITKALSRRTLSSNQKDAAVGEVSLGS